MVLCQLPPIPENGTRLKQFHAKRDLLPFFDKSKSLHQAQLPCAHCDQQDKLQSASARGKPTEKNGGSAAEDRAAVNAVAVSSRDYDAPQQQLVIFLWHLRDRISKLSSAFLDLHLQKKKILPQKSGRLKDVCRHICERASSSIITCARNKCSTHRARQMSAD